MKRFTLIEGLLVDIADSLCFVRVEDVGPSKSESTPESLYAQILGAAIELMASDAASLQMLAADHTSLRLLAWRNVHPDSAAF